MKKSLSIGIVLLVIVGGIFVYITTQQNTSSSPTIQEVSPSEQDSVDMEETSEAANGTHTISEGSSVSYAAQKEWLGKPKEEVVGKNTEVSGNLLFNSEEFALTDLNATINSQTFLSGAVGRDKEVQKMFSEDIIIRLREPIQVPQDGRFIGAVILDVEINSVTKQVTFDTVATVDDTIVSATGEGNILLSDFNITAPSVLNLYTVNETLGISFDIKAIKS